MGKHSWLKSSQGSPQVNGLLDKGCSFEGKLTFDGMVQINGHFRGEIYSDGTLVIGPDAHVNARVMVDTAIIDGYLEGVIEAKSKIELRATGRLVANVATRGLVIEEGALFQGSCQMVEEGRVAVEGERPQQGERLYMTTETEQAVN